MKAMKAPQKKAMKVIKAMKAPRAKKAMRAMKAMTSMKAKTKAKAMADSAVADYGDLIQSYLSGERRGECLYDDELASWP